MGKFNEIPHCIIIIRSVLDCSNKDKCVRYLQIFKVKNDLCD